MPKLRNISWEEAEEMASELVRRYVQGRDKLPPITFIYGVSRGGLPVAQMCKPILQITGHECQLVEDPNKANLIVDDLVDSGSTRDYHIQHFPSAVFETLIEKYDEDEWLVFPWETGERLGPEESVRRLIEFTGDNCKREGLVETPARVIKAFSKIFGGYHMKPESVMKTFTEGTCDNMVVLKNIEFYSTCEHHMLPFYGRCHIAYIPKGKVIGVSKLARLMEIYSRRLQIQERIGQQITQALNDFLEPMGAACIIEAQHFCMTSRGVEKQNSVMVTSSLTGEFLKKEVRQELMALIKE